jgi:hypothetical protein
MQAVFFETDPAPATETLTGRGRLLLVQTFGSLRLPGSVGQRVRIKERQRGVRRGNEGVRAW